MNDQNDRYISELSVPIRLTASHGYNQPGFKSSRTGCFGTKIGDKFTESFSAENINILNCNIKKIELISIEKSGKQVLKVSFTDPTSEEIAQVFVSNLATSLSASISDEQTDAWHGNLYVEVDWIELNLLEPRGSGIRITDSLEIKINQSLALSDYMLECLKWTHYSDIFVDGMRAAHPKTKFIYWFVLLEELEGRIEFRGLFTKLYSDEDKKIVAQVESQLGGRKGARLNSLANDPKVTVEKREVKLAKILDVIGLDEVAVIGGKKIEISEDVCSRLIDMRNKLAHKGGNVEDGLLYDILFPLARGALAYLNSQE